MLIAGVLTWLEAHAGGVTALATLMLVVVTIAYVIITHQLVKEQRLQGNTPAVRHAWLDADGEVENADLKLHNIGAGTAVQVMMLQGPGGGIPIHAPDLGQPEHLLPGEDLMWRIRPVSEREGFPAGRLPLTLSYLDTAHRAVHFSIFAFRFERQDGRLAIFDTNVLTKVITCRDLRRITRRSLKILQRPGFQWRTRRMALTKLLVDRQVRAALRENLTQASKELEAWNRQAEPLRTQV